MAAECCPRLAAYRDIYVAVAAGDPSVFDAAEVEAALEHSGVCYACHCEIEAYRRIVARLAPPQPADEAVAEVAAAVRARVVARVTALEWRRRLVRWGGAAAAVAAVAFLALTLWPRDGSRGLRPRTVVAQASPATLAPPDAGKAPPPWRQAAPIPPVVQRRLEEAARLREEGRVLCRQRRFAEAEAPLRQALALALGILEGEPGARAAEAAHHEAYRCHELLGDYLAREGAFRAYLSRVRERRGDEAAALALVEDARRLLRQRGDDTAALRLERALALSPAGEVALAAHVLTALAAERRGLFDLAYAHYHRALAERPAPALAARIYRSMISVATRHRDFDGAVAHAEALCALPEDTVPPDERFTHQWLLARLYARTGQAAKSVRLLHQMLQAQETGPSELARLELARLAESALGLDGVPN